jgi:hypothetical protein
VREARVGVAVNFLVVLHAVWLPTMGAGRERTTMRRGSETAGVIGVVGIHLELPTADLQEALIPSEEFLLPASEGFSTHNFIELRDSTSGE